MFAKVWTRICLQTVLFLGPTSSVQIREHFHPAEYTGRKLVLSGEGLLAKCNINVRRRQRHSLYFKIQSPHSPHECRRTLVAYPHKIPLIILLQKTIKLLYILISGRKTSPNKLPFKKNFNIFWVVM